MTMSDVPLCVDCAHCVFRDEQNWRVVSREAMKIPRTDMVTLVYRCVAMVGMPNPINGQPIVESDCGMMRLGCDCSREGKLFQAYGVTQ